jgi:hypothetical protein
MIICSRRGALSGCEGSPQPPAQHPQGPSSRRSKQEQVRSAPGPPRHPGRGHLCRPNAPRLSQHRRRLADYSLRQLFANAAGAASRVGLGLVAVGRAADIAVVAARTSRGGFPARLPTSKKMRPRPRRLRARRSYADRGVIDPGRGAEQDHAILRIELRRRSLAGRRMAVAIDLALDVEQRIDALDRFERDRDHRRFLAPQGVGRDLRQLEELPARPCIACKSWSPRGSTTSSCGCGCGRDLLRRDATPQLTFAMPP